MSCCEDLTLWKLAAAVINTRKQHWSWGCGGGAAAVTLYVGPRAVCAKGLNLGSLTDADFSPLHWGPSLYCILLCNMYIYIYIYIHTLYTSLFIILSHHTTIDIFSASLSCRNEPQQFHVTFCILPRRKEELYPIHMAARLGDYETPGLLKVGKPLDHGISHINHGGCENHI